MVLVGHACRRLRSSADVVEQVRILYAIKELRNHRVVLECVEQRSTVDAMNAVSVVVPAKRKQVSVKRQSENIVRLLQHLQRLMKTSRPNIFASKLVVDL
jgi:hypothetical protein